MKTIIKNEEMHKIFLSRAKKEKRCIQCGTKNIVENFYQKKSKQYMCSCLLNVSPMSGTPMHKSHIPPDIWFNIINDIITSNEGVASTDIEKKYSLSNTSSWNLLYKVKAWMNDTEKKEGCENETKFTKIQRGLKEVYVLKFSNDIPPQKMEIKMLDILPPLFEHLRQAA